MKEIPEHGSTESITYHLGDDYIGAVKDSEGDIYYINNGEWHRDDGPAITWYFSSYPTIYVWYLNGLHHSFEAWLEAIGADAPTRTYYTLLYGGPEHIPNVLPDVDLDTVKRLRQ